MTIKSKKTFVCQECATSFSQWSGHCSQCGAWNSIAEELLAAKSHNAGVGYAAEHRTQVTTLNAVCLHQQSRIPTGFEEFDRVLGGGLIAGSAILLGGNPGIGKSTLLLQACHQLSQERAVLYVTGEESLEQVANRAHRLGLTAPKLNLLSETHIERILALAQQHRPQILVVDSIQTVFTEHISSAPGSVSQVRESAAQLVRFAKQTGTILWLVGHVTKDGAIAGPRVLEHMVDTVLYFEDTQDSRYRMIRAIKNRFGAANELGIFAMTEKGLRQVNNPSALFLSGMQTPTPGSVIMATWEGTRPLLLELQTLVAESHTGNPRRICVGFEANRLSMLLAVLLRHANIVTYNQDVFVNAVGGIKVEETAADLALVSAVISSLWHKPLPNDWVIFGEVGLAGEIRPVQNGQERLKEAAKHGFTHAIIPQANAHKTSKAFAGLRISPISHVEALVALLRE